MLTIPPSAKVYLSLATVDFRKQVNGLKKWVQNEMRLNPFTNAYFIFLSRNKKAMKVLHFDGQGMYLYWKVLSEGRFNKWKKLHDTSLSYISLHPTEGMVMLMNGSSHQLMIPRNWQDIG